MSILFIPVGIPGCGKSHFGLGLSANAIVSTDDIRSRITGDANDQSANEQVFAQFHFDIHTWLMGNKSVVADATNLDKSSRERLRAIATQINNVAYDVQNLDHSASLIWPVQTHLILFHNLAQAIERNLRRERTVPADVMLRMMDKYERAVQDISHEDYDFVTEVSAVN
jgi:predicted kinase